MPIIPRRTPRRIPAALGLALLAAGCSLPGDWSYAGLSYDLRSNSFSGLPETTAAQMPTSGSAVFTGEYRHLSRTNPFGKGSASLGVDFAAGTVQLSLTGSVNGTASGTISGSGFSGSSGFDFAGKFYGSTAGVAAGLFSGIGPSDSFGQFITRR